MAFDTRWAPWKQQFSFNSTQSGDIDDWASSAITNPSANYGQTQIISARGYTFVFNLSYPATCYRTTVASGGSLTGTWTSVSTGISTNLGSFALLLVGERIYRLGGLDYTSGHAESSTSVAYATIGSDGSIGAWTTTASLPAGRRYGGVILTPSRIYYMGGQEVRYLVEFSTFVEDSKSTVYYADLDTDGIITGSWSTSANSLPDLRDSAGVAVAGNTVYLIGGDKNSTVQSSIYTATISAGVIGAWSTSSYSYPVTSKYLITCVTGDTLYVIGGLGSSNNPLYYVYYAGLDSSGEMTGNFSSGTFLPGGEGLAYFDALITSAKIYLLGGNGDVELEGYALEATFVGGEDDYSLTPSESNLTPPLSTNNQTFYDVAIELNLAASLLTNSSSVFAPTAAPGTVTLSPPILTNGETFYASALLINLSPSAHGNTQTFYAPTVVPGMVTLTTSLHTNAQTFYAPTVAPGAVALTPTIFTNSQSFYAATISLGAVALVPALFPNTQTFYAPSAVTGDVSLTPALFVNAQTFAAPTVAPGAIDLSLELVTGEQEFFVPELTVVEVTLTVSMRVTNTSSVYAPLITLGDLSMAVPYTANQEEFYLPAVSVGDAALAPQVLTNEQEFYALEAYIGALTLDPPFLDTVTEFFSCLVSEGGLPLVVPFFDNSTSVYAPSVAAVGAILPEEVSGTVSVDIWTSALDQGWGGVLIDEGSLIGTIDHQLWTGTQGEDTWSISIEQGWEGSATTQ